MKKHFSWQMMSLLVAVLVGALLLIIWSVRLGSSNASAEATDLFKTIARSNASDEVLKQQVAGALAHQVRQDSKSVGGLLRASYFSPVQCAKKVADCYLLEMKRDLVVTRQVLVSVTQGNDGTVGIDVSVRTIDK